MSLPDTSLTVRYSALFSPDIAQVPFKELVVSLITLESHVAPYVEVKVFIYISSSDLPSYKKIIQHFSLSITLLPLDSFIEFAADVDFANSIENCETVDRICTLRMLNDFRHLPVESNRLLVGCDVFFISPPDEILSECWRASSTKDVLYMVDGHTFGGEMYRLRHFQGPHLEGLIGDFYYLPPMMTLSEAAIKGCLRLVDSWPAGECRYVPEITYRSTQSEQQSLSILLDKARSRPLPARRYSHIDVHERTAVLHTHDLEGVLRILPPRIRDICRFTMSGIAKEL